LAAPDEDASEVDRLDYGLGEIHGLIAFAMSLAMTHPNRDALLANYESAKKVTGAIAEQQPVSELFLEGLEDVAKRLTRVLKSGGKSRANPDIHS
jgi:hypothetical protein